MVPERTRPEDAEAALFGEALALALTLRLELRAGPPPHGAFDTAERLLRDLAMIDERRGDDTDAGAANDPALRRLEAKLDLTLQLLAAALPQLFSPPPVPVRIGARGLRLPADPAMPDAAVLRWQPADSLPLCLHLPVSRFASDATQDWWAFAPLPEALDDALSRHLFRLHRREIATQRRA